MKYISQITLTVLATTALGLISLAQAETTATASKLSAGDKKFVKQAYKGGITEVANGKMAQEKAKDAATKKVAARLIKDHSKADARLEAIAKEENLDLSSVQPKRPNLSEANFDKEYLSMLQKDHEKDIAMFEKEANDVKPGEDRDVPTFARKTLPTLKEHLAMINDALAKVK